MQIIDTVAFYSQTICKVCTFAILITYFLYYMTIGCLCFAAMKCANYLFLSVNSTTKDVLKYEAVFWGRIKPTIHSSVSVCDSDCDHPSKNPNSHKTVKHNPHVRLGPSATAFTDTSPSATFWIALGAIAACNLQKTDEGFPNITSHERLSQPVINVFVKMPHAWHGKLTSNESEKPIGLLWGHPAMYDITSN